MKKYSINHQDISWECIIEIWDGTYGIKLIYIDSYPFDDEQFEIKELK